MLNYLMLFVVAGAVCADDEKRPNFVIILTDDQDVALGGMSPMLNVRRFIAREGVTFANSYTTSPICCPSRASFLTGQYLHNHHTHNNSLNGGCYGASWRHREKDTFPAILNSDGYNTFYAGKYLNQYGSKKAGGPEVVPPGWSEWHGLVGNSVYYNYTISNNGVPTHSTDLYLTDVIRDLGINFIENQTESRPFLMVLAPPAPHQPFTPAPRHKDIFNNVTAVRHPNFNIASEDKHWLIRMTPTPLPSSLLPELDRVYRSRWETLLAVDEMVADVVNALDTQSLLDNTYIIYTSDNGYHIGQFAQVYDKRQPYETDIKVPLIIKGPGLKKNMLNYQPVLNIDLAPTILNLAGVAVNESKWDGKVIDFDNQTLTQRYMLVEYEGEGGSVDPKCEWVYDAENLAECKPEYDCKCQDSKNNTYACLIDVTDTKHVKYCLFRESHEFEELYNIHSDQYELVNIADKVLPALKHWYQFILSKMVHCKGDTCDKPIPPQFRT